MSAWVLVPCLVMLRTEFNAVSPDRDKGADGSIGDSLHTSSSDHTPDEDSDVLRDHDADHKNEVHALDIDSSGPWPSREWFEFAILDLVAREKAAYESTTMVGRLQYVIWNHRIASRSWGWTWRAYSGQDPHTNHAHFSARYTTAQENDTSPWGVADGTEEDMALNDDLITITNSTAAEIGKKEGEKVSAATLLQLAVIYAARADDKAAANTAKLDAQAAKLDAQAAKLDAQAARLAALEASVGQVDEQTAARIFEGSNDQLAAVFLEALGPVRAREVAQQILNA